MGGGRSWRSTSSAGRATRCPSSSLGEALAGGAGGRPRAGCPVVGGHSVDDPEPKYGMAVTGEVAHPDAILHQHRPARRRRAARRPSRWASGWLNTADKRASSCEELSPAVVASMTALSNATCRPGSPRDGRAGGHRRDRLRAARAPPQAGPGQRRGRPRSTRPRCRTSTGARDCARGRSCPAAPAATSTGSARADVGGYGEVEVAAARRRADLRRPAGRRRPRPGRRGRRRTGAARRGDRQGARRIGPDPAAVAEADGNRRCCSTTSVLKTAGATRRPHASLGAPWATPTYCALRPEWPRTLRRATLPTAGSVSSSRRAALANRPATTSAAATGSTGMTARPNRQPLLGPGGRGDVDAADDQPAVRRARRGARGRSRQPAPSRGEQLDGGGDDATAVYSAVGLATTSRPPRRRRGQRGGVALTAGRPASSSGVGDQSRDREPAAPAGDRR